MINLWFILFVCCFLIANGKLIKKNIIIGNITVYEYFFEEILTVDDFINSGWSYSGNNIPVSLCAGKSLFW